MASKESKWNEAVSEKKRQDIAQEPIIYKLRQTGTDWLEYKCKLSGYQVVARDKDKGRRQRQSERYVITLRSNKYPLHFSSSNCL